MDTALHFHHMHDNVNGGRMPGIECQRAPRDFFGATVLSIFFEGKSVHCQHAGVARHRGGPLRQHFRDPIAHRTPPA